MARPGTLHAAGTGLAPPAPLVPSAAAVLLTLVDGETPLFAAPGFAPARDWIGFHCGAVPVGAVGEAGFVLADALPDLAAVQRRHRRVAGRRRHHHPAGRRPRAAAAGCAFRVPACA